MRFYFYDISIQVCTFHSVRIKHIKTQTVSYVSHNLAGTLTAKCYILYTYFSVLFTKHPV